MLNRLVGPPAVVRRCLEETLPIVTAALPFGAKQSKSFYRLLHGTGLEALQKATSVGAVLDALPPPQLRNALRGLFIALPAPVCRQLPESVLAAMDEILKVELDAAKGECVDPLALPRARPHVVLWQGDMTLLLADAVVNPGNQALLGCFKPEHRCLDNILHGAAGPRLRIACAELLEGMGTDFDTNGNCRVTAGFGLPAKHVFHTVGPCLVEGRHTRQPTATDEAELRSCYRTCFDAAVRMDLRSVAFCCISAGVFGYPNDRAAFVAVDEVSRCLADFARTAAPGAEPPLIIFNVFADVDLRAYQQLLAPAPQEGAAAAAPPSAVAEADSQATVVDE